MKTMIAVLMLAAPRWIAAEETAAFLKLGVGARAAAMGGAYTAIASDISSLHWNPAGLAAVPKRELGGTHAELIEKTRYDALGYAQTTRFGTFGIGTVYLSQGSIEGRDAQGRPTGSFTASDNAIMLGYGSRLAGIARLGGAIKYIRSTIGSDSAETFAVDLGAQRAFAFSGPGVPVLGVSIQNLGPGMRFAQQSSSLPLALALGAGYRLPAGLVLAADFRHRPHSRQNEVAIGTEYAIISGLALRAGYGSTRSSAGTATTLPLNGFVGGFGLKVYGYNLDYSIAPFGTLGNVQRFSFGARF